MSNIIQLPETVTVQVKDLGGYQFRTDVWTTEFVVNAVSAAIRDKFDSVRNAPKYKDANSGDRDKMIEEVAEPIRNGEFSVRGTQAASLDAVEVELRQVLTEAFEKGGYKKKSAVLAIVNKADRWEQYRDLVVKKQLQQIATDAAELEQLMSKLQLRTDNQRQAMEGIAERRAEAIAKLKAEIALNLDE